MAIAVPLRTLFDYLPPAGVTLAPGCRVRVPFGRTRKIGLVVSLAEHSDCPPAQLKPIQAVLDEAPLFGDDDLDFLRWVAGYYHHPIGEVMATALPLRLRTADRASLPGEVGWRLTDAGLPHAQQPPGNAPRQAAVLRRLAEQSTPVRVTDLADGVPDPRATTRALEKKGWVECVEIAANADPGPSRADGLALNDGQASCLTALRALVDRFAVALLDGVTGSGKTEVYLQLAADVVARGKRVLVLVPEISLTPQLAERFRERLGETVRVMHSGLSDGERERVWHRMRLGLSQILLGTRSAVFTPLPNLGLIVVDEEHDPSYKQTEGFRYSARDMALVRAQRAACPIVLGSATPSLESLRNAESGRYRHLRLERRAGEAQRPKIDLLDIRAQPLQSGISTPLLDRVAENLARGGQVLLFLNRRGFAPVLSCYACGWLSDCPRCDARQTVHRGSGLLWCHHCGAQRPVPTSCPECAATELHPLGQGTEQVDAFLAERFAETPLIRVDRDATARKGSLEQQLQRLHAAGPALLVGTQMLAKGHHFPRVTLVGVLDADGGLFSADFRATERMAQLLVQVAGRAGRGERPGRVVIQTRHPDHPLLQTLVREGYSAFAKAALREREAAAMPPFSHQALIRAESGSLDDASGFLDQLAGRARALSVADVALWGPVPAPMARRAGRHRAHLLMQSARREPLHRLITELLDGIPRTSGVRRVRWSLDVDPIDLF